MWKISQQYKMSYSDFIGLNPQIKNPSVINVGQSIVVRTNNIDSKASDLVDYAKILQNVTTYSYGANKAPFTTDCSGWTQHIYSKFGISLPRVSNSQANVGKPVKFNELQKGDIMAFSSNVDKTINHVGIYLGNGYWISNLNITYNVKIESIYSSYCQKYFMWGSRVL